MTETLKLTLKKRFFDMIQSGEKPEEYREIKPFWIGRLATDAIINKVTKKVSFYEFRHFDQIQFFNGAYYSESLPNFIIECKGIHIGKGHPEWGAVPGITYFILMLGKIIRGQKREGLSCVNQHLIHLEPYPGNN